MVPTDANNFASPLRPASQEQLVTRVPNPLDGISWDIIGLTDDTGHPVGPLDSSSVGPRHWIYMAQTIERFYETYDGFVVLHGTDTMAFTASALSFLLHNLNKPVVITGSQLPIYKARTDAVMNFVNSLTIAGWRASDLPRIPEVIICFGETLLRGNRTTKISTSGWQGFASPNFPTLGRIGERIMISDSLLRAAPTDSQLFFAYGKIEENVATIAIYPGMGADVLERMLSVDVKGVILRTFGAGNAPESERFVQVLKRAVEDGKIVVNTTQCLEGVVEQGLYEASFGLQNAGLITGLDLTPEAALTKLMWLLATEAPDEVSVQMQISQRGEQSGSVFDIRFGRVARRNAPVDTIMLSQRPPGQFQVGTLQRAVLRLSGVGMHVAKESENIRIAVFINLPKAGVDTPKAGHHFAGELSGVYNGSEQTVLLREITPTIERVHETGRPINLTLVATEGEKFWAEGAYLTLFNQ
jgi:L-asparaginase